MLTAKKKIVKRDAGQEPATFSWANIQDQVVENGKLIGGIAAVIVILIVAFYFYRAGQAEDNATASAMLSKVQTLYQQGQYKMAIDGDPARGIPGLKDIAEQYGGTPSGQQALLFLGNAYLYTDQLDKALTAFEAASPDSDMLEAAVMAGKATAYYNKGEYKIAADFFEKAALKFPNDLISAERNLKAAEANLRAGKKEEARELLAKVKNAKTTKFDRDLTRISAQYDIDLNNLDVN